MKRTCDGHDPNLLRPVGVTTRPCDCGATFDDVDRTVSWPHRLLPPPLTEAQVDALLALVREHPDA